MNKIKFVLAAISLAFIFGCASNPKPVDREEVKDLSRDVDKVLDE